ncbi:hypothetical protein HPB50_011064 [Hyalomma asiaticum]|uniref:Uncharacterized protein n=1 Tax=Hyalomma asiaticum TaxID=266040 RepID=A0ACB7S010_HYAAI|nr:hypothetical protein HPB50_011064 [Hyalomma asiaticum]
MHRGEVVAFGTCTEEELAAAAQWHLVPAHHFYMELPKIKNGSPPERINARIAHLEQEYAQLRATLEQLTAEFHSLRRSGSSMAPAPAPKQLPTEAPTPARSVIKRALTEPVEGEGDVVEFKSKIRNSMKEVKESFRQCCGGLGSRADLFLSRTEEDKVDCLIHQAYKSALSLPISTSTDRLLSMGVHNSLTELTEAHRTAQLLRLSRTRPGRALLSTLELSPLMPLPTSPPIPSHVSSLLAIDPLPKNMHPEHHPSRRAAHASALWHMVAFATCTEEVVSAAERWNLVPAEKLFMIHQVPAMHVLNPKRYDCCFFWQVPPPPTPFSNG